MIEEELAKLFKDNGWTWRLKDRGQVTPTAEDMQSALDEAARLLYNREVGASLEVGRLIIQKKHRGHDVYVYAGSYD